MDFQTIALRAAAREPASATSPGSSGPPLTRGAWVDVLRSWLPDADDVFEALVRDVPWRAERRQMYDRIVDVPRLVHTYMIGEELPHPVLDRGARRADRPLPARARRAVPHRRLLLLPRRPRQRGLARRHHRPRQDHRHDGRDRLASATRAGCTCGRGWAGPTRSPIEMGHGDLVVMGGSCQRTWEHAVPKVAHAGPRISVQFRPLNVF